MPNIPQPQRQEEPAVTDADLAALLAGTAGAASGLRPVADVLAALTAEATATELAGEGRALAEFRRRAGGPVPSRRARRGTAGLTSRLGVKVAASVAAVAVGLGGGAAAAFAGVLPAPIQRLAHDTIGAPAPTPRVPAPAPRHDGKPAAQGRPAHGKSAARGGPGAQQQGRPHATPAPTAPGNPHARGKHGKPQGKGQGGQGNGRGQENGKRHGQQGNGQGPGAGDPHKNGQPGNPHEKGGSGSPHALRRGGPHTTLRRGPAQPGTSQS